MPFRFRQFTVEDRCSTQRVGTDAMLLGAWASPGEATSILDIGTGCGVLALMMAQKSNARIDAIDPDEASAAEAARNFMTGPWGGRMRAIRTDLETWAGSCPGPYGFIVSNPPYFMNSLKSPAERKNRARHAESLPPGRLAFLASRLLAPGGTFALILPATAGVAFSKMAAANGLSMDRVLHVRSDAGKPVQRILAGYRAGSLPVPEPEFLTLRGNDGSYTPEYLALTGEYHHF